jgi:holin-like protein
MKLLRQLFFILLFAFFGELVSFGLKTWIPGLVVPGALIGLGILTTLLLWNKLKLSEVEDVGLFLTGNMSFFFLPAAVSILKYLDILSAQIVSMVLLILLTLLIAFFTVLGSVKLVLFLQTKGGMNRE